MFKLIGRAVALAGTVLLLGAVLLVTQQTGEDAGLVSHWVFAPGDLRGGTIRDRAGRLPAQVTGGAVFGPSGGLEMRPLRDWRRPSRNGPGG